jgi:hypothetical protein
MDTKVRPHGWREGTLAVAAAAWLAIACDPTIAATRALPVDAGTPVDARPKAIAFEPNHGQSDERVRYIARGGDYTVFLTATEAVLSLRGRPGDDPAVVTMRFEGANPSAPATVHDPLPGKINYVPASGPQERLSNIPTFAKVRYAGVYPGVDVVFYDTQGQLEYDFVVAPGADPAAIALDFDGARTLRIDDDGALVLETAAGRMRQAAPFVYQERDGARERVAGRWTVEGRKVGVQLGDYDRERTLVIDPLISYSSYLGGTGDDGGMDIAVDTAGNTYVAGGTTSPNFPGTVQRGSTANAAFVTKFNVNGQLLYSTYLLETDERGATGVAVDAMGNAYVTGRTSLYRATASNDVFVAKLDAFGRAIRPAGYFITFGGDRIDYGNRIAVDGAGNVYVTGTTQGGTFPTTSGAFRRTPAGEHDAFVTKINAAGTAFVYSTLLGGSADESANDLALDAFGNVYPRAARNRSTSR